MLVSVASDFTVCICQMNGIVDKFRVSDMYYVMRNVILLNCSRPVLVGSVVVLVNNSVERAVGFCGALTKIVD